LARLVPLAKWTFGQSWSLRKSLGRTFENLGRTFEKSLEMKIFHWSSPMVAEKKAQCTQLAPDHLAAIGDQLD